MALKNPSLFLYGLQITVNNQNITFGTNSGETPGSGTARTAIIPVGYYSLTGLAIAVAQAITNADPTHVYSCTVDRTNSGGTQNRVTIATTNTYLSIYFNTGSVSNPATLLGFTGADLTGATSYTGSASAGTVLIPNQIGYSFLPTQAMQKNFGSLNVSASGLKESITFALQSFWQVQFKYIPEATMEASWLPLVQWLIQQREVDFTPDITAPTTVYTGTLEDPQNGLEFNFTEHLSEGLPFEYATPLMKFRVRPT